MGLGPEEQKALADAGEVPLGLLVYCVEKHCLRIELLKTQDKREIDALLCQFGLSAIPLKPFSVKIENNFLRKKKKKKR